MIVDSLSEDPIVITGPANLSDASTTNKDENMIIVRGNKRVADIYLDELMRLFNHFSFRESLQWRDVSAPPNPLRTDEWWKVLRAALLCSIKVGLYHLKSIFYHYLLISLQLN